MRVHFLILVVLITGICHAADYTEIIGYEGQSLRVDCPYSSGNEVRGKYFCRLEGLPCNDLVRTAAVSKWAETGRFALFDNTSARFFTLTISELKANDSGKYWCGVDISYLPDVVNEVRITVKGVGNSTSAFTVQETTKSSSSSLIELSGLEDRQQQSHFRFLAVITMTCVGMLFFVCIFSMAHVLKRINSCKQPGSASYNITAKADKENVEDEYVTMKPGVGQVSSPAAEDKNSPSSEPHSPPQMHGTGAVAASPEIEPYYLETLAAMKTDLDADYTQPTRPTLSVYENLMNDSMEEPVYHTLD